MEHCGSILFPFLLKSMLVALFWGTHVTVNYGRKSKTTKKSIFVTDEILEQSSVSRTSKSDATGTLIMAVPLVFLWSAIM